MMKSPAVLLLLLLALASSQAADQNDTITTPVPATTTTNTTTSTTTLEKKIPYVSQVEDLSVDSDDADTSGAGSDSALKCEGTKVSLSGESAKDKTDLTVVDNYLDFMNQTDPTNLHRQTLKGLSDIFVKKTYWKLVSDSVVYPLLIRVTVKTSVCIYPSIQKMSMDLKEVPVASVKIAGLWYPVKIQPGVESYTIDLAKAVPATFFEVYLSKGSIKKLKVALCCEEK